jgi:type II secretory ATPase GspE/PulE/Tfp pilus assembly ATPase PilB-like protein
VDVTVTPGDGGGSHVQVDWNRASSGAKGFLVVGAMGLVGRRRLRSGYKKVFDRLQKDYGFGKPDYVMYKPVGCDACGNTGYKGRVGLHEMLVGTDPMKKLIQEHARVAEMLATALAEGMLTLKMDGMEKVLQGLTDMAQVRAVCIK